MRVLITALITGGLLSTVSFSYNDPSDVATTIANTHATVCSLQPVEEPVAVTAAAWQITELATGKVLGELAPQTILPMASVVKLLTAQAVLSESGVYTDTITISLADVATEGRAGNLVAGQVYTAHELLFPLLLTSSNDAGAALARAYPGIVERMQQFADELGAFQTTIVDTTGLSALNQTTAADVSRIVRALYQSTPHIFDITRMTQRVSWYDNGWLNNIPFRTLPGFRGGKQGFLYEARHTGVALFSDTGTPPIIVVVLASDNIADDVARLREAALSTYRCSN
jgi:D-alanyl-D-alanine carboxypeptidase